MKKLFTYFEKKLSYFFERVCTNVSVDAKSMGYFRILIGILLLSNFLPTWQWLSEVPQSFYNPHLLSLSYFFKGFPNGITLFILDLLVLVLCILIMLGIYTRMSFILFFLVSSIGYSFAYSFGKIDHGTTMFLFGMLSLGFTNSGSHYAILKDKELTKETQRLALALLAILICFGMFTAGLSKFIKWFDFDLSQNGFLKWFYTGYYIYDRDYLLAKTVLKAPYWIIELADYSAPILELLGFYFLYKSKRSWQVYITILCVFHLGNLLLLNIPFTYNIMIYGIFLIAPNLKVILESTKHLNKLKRKTALIFMTLILGAYQLIKRIMLFKEPTPNLDYEQVFLEQLYIGIVLWMLIIISGVLLLFKMPKVKLGKSL